MARCFRPLSASQLEDGTIVFSGSPRFASGRLLELPCGKCIGCVRGRSQAWALRCRHEAMMHERNSFLTLTFSDDKLPAYSHLEYADFQNFMKRLRRRLGDTRIRFFAAGEYGDRTHRPHFHALIFGEDFRSGATVYKKGFWESPLVSKAWKNGQALVGPLTSASAAYVAQYAMKKFRGDDVDRATGFVRETKLAMSQGIGRKWFELFHGDLAGDFAVMDNYQIPVPRYYRERLRGMDPVGYEVIEHDRYLKSKMLPLEERSAERRAVQEQVAIARFADSHSDREV